ncbi:MAG: ABC transporter ATP-binding protein [Verrucomicrobiota bacterium]
MLLDVQDLTVRFYTRDGVVHAVEGVSFELDQGQTMGIVGESGSGKSVSCYALLGLLPLPPGKIERGQALFDGRDLLRLPQAELQAVRGSRISMIFQDPMTSLNPYLKISTQLMEPLLLHEKVEKAEALERAIQSLEEVGVRDAAKRIHSYPHEFSGGMRQRVMIAMALITRPEILIADEPTTALDVTVQKQVLDLIKERQEKLGTAVIFVTHDLAVVSQVCDRVNVMYAGRIVESAPTRRLFQKPRHAYTRALQRSIPGMQSKGEALYSIPGTPPSLTEPPAGCAFAPRNELGIRSQCCEEGAPAMKEMGPGHLVQDCPGCLANSD